MRTDDHNNPTAFTTAIALSAGLVLGTDYEQGESFEVSGVTYWTAKLLGDPLDLTIKVIDSLGFRTKSGHERWVYINFPHFVWLELSKESKIDVIGWMYQQEGGITMRSMFPHYGEK
jgi:hypothetical protein